MRSRCVFCREPTGDTVGDALIAHALRSMLRGESGTRPTAGPEREAAPGIVDRIAGRLSKGQPSLAFSTAVCADCKEGWLACVAERARPLVASLIQGHASRLDAEDQTRVAAWAAAIAVIG